MKSVKITKTMLKDPETLLMKVGAFYKKEGFPFHVFISPKDYVKLRKNTLNHLKKEYKGVSVKSLKKSLGMIMLNLSPSIVKGVQEGYLLIDQRAINQEIEERSGSSETIVA